MFYFIFVFYLILSRVLLSKQNILMNLRSINDIFNLLTMLAQCISIISINNKLLIDENYVAMIIDIALFTSPTLLYVQTMTKT